jgi:hypothetical protein
MRKLFFNLLFCGIFTVISSFTANKPKPTLVLGGGDIQNLKGVRTIRIIYDYSTMSVGKFTTEEEFVSEKEAAFNGDSMKIERFRNAWFAPRAQAYEPEFWKALKYMLAKSNIVVTNYAPDADATLRVITTHMETGFFYGFADKAGFINFKFIFSDREGNDLVRYWLENVPTHVASMYDTSIKGRIAPTYNRAGLMLGKELKKKLSQ